VTLSLWRKGRGKGSHVVVVEDGEPAHVEHIGDTGSCREGIEVQALHGINEIFAQLQRVEMKVHLEESDDYIQHRLLLLCVVCTRRRDQSGRASRHRETRNGRRSLKFDWKLWLKV
jgi:hypothetical protein